MPKRARKIVDGTAKRISNAVGGRNLTEYMGAKIAKARAPKEQKKYIKSKATGTQALASAGNVALSVGLIASTGAVASSARVAKSARAAKQARTIPKSFKVAGQAKPVKVNNWANATQVPRRTRPVKFKITKWK